METIIFVGLALLLIAIALRNRTGDEETPDPIRCPNCLSDKTLVVDSYVSKIVEERKGIIQSDSDFILMWKHRWRCQTCGHDWQQRMRERR